MVYTNIYQLSMVYYGYILFYHVIATLIIQFRVGARNRTQWKLPGAFGSVFVARDKRQQERKVLMLDGQISWEFCKIEKYRKVISPSIFYKCLFLLMKDLYCIRTY